MIKKLRLQFILISMISIFFVMSAVIMTINFSNFYAIENSTRHQLTEVLKRDINDFPGPGGEPNPGEGTDPKKTDEFIQEDFIYATVAEDGTIQDFVAKFPLNDQECKELIITYYNRTKNYDKIGSYRYKKAKVDSLTKIAIIDVYRNRHQAFVSMYGSFVVAVVAYALIFVLILVMSRIVLRVNEKAYKNQKEFITNASHELKTPLTIISTDVEIIEMDHGQSEWTKSIKDQIQNLTQMTNQLVTSARLEEDNTSSYEMDNFNISEVAEESIEAFAASFKSKHLVLTQHIEKNVMLYGNRYLINELFYIFFDNALKYCEEHGDFDVTLKKNKKQVEITFANTLPKDNEINVDQLFERFYRDPKAKVAGTGIGLSISKQIVELHKGKIQAVQEGDKIKFIVIL
ncbi:MAG: HAMP domain-containing histidine kinase [Bacilli bacterium]|nr:HAMP domain-containing histidine kinase [Bacilli bacterium]